MVYSSGLIVNTSKKFHNKWMIDKSELEKYLVYRHIEIENIREFGQKLKNTRDQLGLSQPQLVVILGVSHAAVSRWEHGNRSPRTENSKQILRLLQEVSK